MRILVTNDDGVDAPGLLALKRALDALGETLVVAPEHNWSAAGHRKTMHKPLRLAQVRLDDGTPAYAASGSPSDCVALVMLGAFRRRRSTRFGRLWHQSQSQPRPGHDVFRHGHGCDGRHDQRSAVVCRFDGHARSEARRGVAEPFAVAAEFAVVVARKVMAEGLPPGVLLNVNVPGWPEQTSKACRSRGCAAASIATNW